MDDEQKNQDVHIEQLNKAHIGDIIEENDDQVDPKEDVEVDEEKITDATIDPHLTETYMPNIKRDDTKKEDDIIEDYIDQE